MQGWPHRLPAVCTFEVDHRRETRYGAAVLPDPEPSGRYGQTDLLRIALLSSVALLALRLVAAEAVGWGDAEALYACWALFRQPSYLDHPGFIGWIGAILAGANGVPDPVTTHRVTATAATGFAWLGGLAARGVGASWRGALLAVLALLIVPELAIGLFAFTPDLPLAFAWIAALGCAGVALRYPPSSWQATAGTVGAGLFTGVALMSKISGATLALALVATWLSRPARPRLKTIAPYAALLVGMVTPLPCFLREAGLGWPMLHHRLVHTQLGFGPTFRNLGSLLGGQLLYVTPVVLFAVVILAVDLTRRRDGDAVHHLLLNATLYPFGVLAALSLLSRVAEPHWVAPSYLALALHLARRGDDSPPVLSRRLGWTAALTSVCAVALVFVVVFFPVLPRLLGHRYQPRYDLTNDLFVWKRFGPELDAALDSARADDLGEVAVVGPHWIVCAQAQAWLGNRARVGCLTDIGDDFDTFYPRAVWRNAPSIIYITDDRFQDDPAKVLPDRSVRGVDRVTVRRGGVAVRTFRVLRLGRVGAG